jgi:predicted 3-demethylubiquinone-9 3-methyltransferase (glyoxalase superfamily)
LVVEFELGGTPFIALNGGPVFPPTPAFSMFVACPTQREVDVLWSRLVRGGRPSQCGWLVDRFGLSWQIIPKRLSELLGDPDPVRAGRALKAMMKMHKIVVRTLERAAQGP